jgi:hypothetical protein
MFTGFWLGNLKERYHLGELGADDRRIKIDLKERGGEGVDRTRLIHDRDNECSGSVKRGSFVIRRGTTSFTRRSLSHGGIYLRFVHIHRQTDWPTNRLKPRSRKSLPFESL